jgi:TRAP-type mannitol/chloroaromatic compound transport system permease small subunit
MSAFWLYAGFTLAFIMVAVLPTLAWIKPFQTLDWSDRIATFVSAIGKIAAWLALLLMITIIFDVVTRSLKGSDWIQDWPTLYGILQGIEPYASSTKLQELEWHLHGALFLFAFGFAYIKDAHVRIELARDRFSVRTRCIVEMVGIVLLMLPYAFLLIDFGYGFAVRSFQQGEGSSALTGLPNRWIIKTAIPLGFILVTLAAVSVYMKCAVYLFGPAELRDRAGAFVTPPKVPVE